MAYRNSSVSAPRQTVEPTRPARSIAPETAHPRIDPYRQPLQTIRDWPESERPREKLLARGAAALCDAELLALFIGSGRRGQTAVDVGRDLLSAHASLKVLLELDIGAMSAQPGIGPAKACRLQAALELGRRYLACDLDRPDALTHPAACADYLRARIGGYPYEVFACVFLDNRHRVIACEELFRGSIDGASVHPRDVVRRCLSHNAAAVIFAHNHRPVPSRAATRHCATCGWYSTIEVRARWFHHRQRQRALLAERGWL
jgi:DNA repair protein RadC